ncbi:tetratricopeptide repeat protein [Pajaroellobacter abortibovis]|uniref:Tetratricopeptide repeat protein n=1 Tax=Pajaroellobacter abortibovis TaxID=1882918 RepID=A0A1L6MXJ5_9BACT|nr:tetratricopeptide repeat protein [Pajaroellobacter abortibovis]APS00303.1 hypothetical protein BCY86_06115 [Pajaroellobacter abortibovis]
MGVRVSRWLIIGGTFAFLLIGYHVAVGAPSSSSPGKMDGGAPPSPMIKDGGVETNAAADEGMADHGVADGGGSPLPGLHNAGSKAGFLSSEHPWWTQDGGIPPARLAIRQKLRMRSKKENPPTVEAAAAYRSIKAEADVYEQETKQYRNLISGIIQLQYEAKKKQILARLNSEVIREKEALKRAQETTIARLEHFVSQYSGPRAHPEATPDAMYRLAALYEELARTSEGTEDVSPHLEAAIKLYQRIIKEYPNYREIAGVHYYLGHAYNDTGRINEAQYVWRSLVCHNRYVYKVPDPSQPASPLDTALPQDKSEEDWIVWRRRYPSPEHLKAGRKDPDTRFIDPYPAECKPLHRPSASLSEDPPYLAEIWWQIGNWEFDQLDYGGGRVLSKEEPDLVALPAVYDYNRAASAYKHSLEFKKPPLYGVALYKYAWTLFKQQRYEAATRAFVQMLLYTDQQEKATGDPGADFRGEGYTYIAGSLLNVDFVGPDPDAPFIPRPDILDTELNPAVIEQKLHVALERLQDPLLIPQDKPWTIEIYRGLAQEYKTTNQFNNAIEVYQLILSKWPLHSIAPDIQASIAEAYDQIASLKSVGSPEYTTATAKSLEARTALANYIGDTPWVRANKNYPSVLHKAEKIVTSGLRFAAVQHTNNGRGALHAGEESKDRDYRINQLLYALSEYKFAVEAWHKFLQHNEQAPDAYETRYWLADAWHKVVRIQFSLHSLDSTRFAEPGQREMDTAMAAALAVRDSEEDDKNIDNASLWVVDLADVKRDLAYQQYQESGGTRGIEDRKEVHFVGEGDERKVATKPIPEELMEGIRRRDEYIELVPSNKDPEKNGPVFDYYIAELFFLYGQFGEASARFRMMKDAHCGKDEYGYKAWEKLITMSNVSGNADLSRRLAEEEKTKPCAVNAEQLAKSALIINPTLQEAAYVRARDKFKEAQNETLPMEERNKLWIEAAGLYEAALSAAPARDEAPEAAMNAAFAYKQIGNFGKAIELYNRFIDEYGNEQRLSLLEKGSKAQKIAPNPAQYQERIKYLSDAYDALSTTYFGFFNYRMAAETYATIASLERLDEAKRRTAAQNAMVLYAKMDQRAAMQEQYLIFRKLHPSPEERSDADYMLASYDYRLWNPDRLDVGTNRVNRINAEESLTNFYKMNLRVPTSSKYVVEAAYRVAKMLRKAGDPMYMMWYRRTMNTWNALKESGLMDKKLGKPAALTSPYVDYVAQMEFMLIDEKLRERYDYDTGHHRYAGAVEEIIGKYEIDKKTGAAKLLKRGKYQLDAEDADKYDTQLQRIIDTYPSLEWVPATIARKGSLYDSLRTGLYNTVPPALKYFTPQQEALLQQLENSGRDERIEQADEIRSQVKEGWRNRRDRELNASDEVMVRNYATAVALAGHYNVKNAEVQRALARLAYYTDIIGDAKIRTYVEKTKDPTDPKKMLSYTDGMYVQSRSGLLLSPTAGGALLPVPAVP